MSEVTRYDHVGLDLEIRDDGQWITFDDYEALKKERDELIGALKDLLAIDENISSATDVQLREAMENGWAPDIRNQAASIIAAREAIAKAEGSKR